MLVSDDEVYAYLDIVREEDDPHGVALSIRDSVEALFATETNQIYGPEEEIVEEPHDGKGTHFIFTDRPIAALTEIFIRYNDADQTEYFSVDILEGVSFKVGGRRIYSRSVKFPCDADNVLITYTAQANQPVLAKQAIREAVAALFGKIGSEHARSEQVGTYSHVMIRDLNESLLWRKAIEALQIPVLG